MPAAPWSIRLSQAAERDFREIHEWTAAKFGASQAEVYAAAVSMTIDALHGGPNVVGFKAHDEIATALRSAAVRVKRRDGRHLVFFRVFHDAHEIAIVRILHVAMNPLLHLTPEPKA